MPIRRRSAVNSSRPRLLDVAVEERQPAARWLLKQTEQAQQGCLAGAGRAHQKHEVALAQRELEVLQDLGAVTVAHGNVVEPEHAGEQWSLRSVLGIVEIAQTDIFVQSLLN